MQVKYIMNRDVVTAAPDMRVDEARKLLVQHRVSGLPVVDAEDRVLGVLSQTDLLSKHGQHVNEMMTSPAIVVDDEAGIEEVATLMAAKDINRLPVVRDCHLVGIISRADIVRYVATRRAWHGIEGPPRQGGRGQTCPP